jgi:transposase-like protein
MEERMKSGKLGKQYTPKLKFQIVLEVLQGGKKMGQIAKAYGVHPVTLTHWKNEFLQKGPEVFGQRGTMQDYEKKIGELEQLIGHKEVEIALLKNFLGGSSPRRRKSS